MSSYSREYDLGANNVRNEANVAPEGGTVEFPSRTDPTLLSRALDLSYVEAKRTRARERGRDVLPEGVAATFAGGAVMRKGTAPLSSDSVVVPRVLDPRIVLPARLTFSRYTQDTPQTISDATRTIVNFETKDSDTNNRVTTGASWKFTAAVAGVYSVTANVTFTTYNGWAVNDEGELTLYKNGVVFCQLDYRHVMGVSGGVITQMALRGATCLELLAGDYIDVRVLYNAAAATLATDGSVLNNHVSILRIDMDPTPTGERIPRRERSQLITK